MPESTAQLDFRRRASRLLDSYRVDVTAELRRALEPLPSPLFGFARYHLGWQDRDGRERPPTGGKMLRPALCLACCRAACGETDRALPAAAALELTHNFTLIHDDIEDESRLRHGQETVWSVWGLAHGVNAGDALFALAERTVLRLADRSVPADRVLRAAALLNGACLRLCEGQYLDLEFERRADVSRAEYVAMIDGKTASLLAAAAAIGALAGGADEPAVEGFERFGRTLGLAFQVQDDYLGAWGPEEETGKPGADIRDRKKSFPVVYALEAASPEHRRRLRELYGRPDLDDAAVDEALAVLDRCGAREATRREAQRLAAQAVAVLDTLGLQTDDREDLAALARYVAERER